eukprot:m51a1_g10709 hypothetical protein (506) ;mRNA; f:179649-182825
MAMSTVTMMLQLGRGILAFTTGDIDVAVDLREPLASVRTLRAALRPLHRGNVVVDVSPVRGALDTESLADVLDRSLRPLRDAVVVRTFACAYHERLGADSPLALFPVPLLGQLFDLGAFDTQGPLGCLRSFVVAEGSFEKIRGMALELLASQRFPDLTSDNLPDNAQVHVVVRGPVAALDLGPVVRRHRGIELIDCCGCGITQLPDDVCALSTLAHLLLSRNELTALPRKLHRLQSLKQLLVDNNRLEHLPKGLYKLPELVMFNMPSSHTCLEITGNPLLDGLCALEGSPVQKHHKSKAVCTKCNKPIDSVSALTFLLVLSGIIAGAGVALEVLWFTVRDIRIEWPEYYYERSFSGHVGPGGCMVVLIPDDGYFTVYAVSSKLEFTVVNQNSTQCREPRTSHWNIEAMSRNRTIYVGWENRQGNYIVVNALQDHLDGNQTTFIKGSFYIELKGDRLRDTVFLYVPPEVYIALGVLFGAVCCAVLFVVLRQHTTSDDEQGQSLLRS